jgi:hypothetical protein
MSPGVGGPTSTCRSVCSVLIAAPLVYWSFVTDGDAYLFLILVLIAPVAGLILFGNSLFCLFRYRTLRSASVSLLFMLVAAVGFLTARHFLPQFHM